MIKSHFEEIPSLIPTFNDFAECTDYFYNEYGKLEQISNLSKSRVRKQRKRIDKMFDICLNLIDKQMDVQKDLETSTIKETKANLKLSKKEFAKDYTKALLDVKSKVPKHENVIENAKEKPTKCIDIPIKDQMFIEDVNITEEKDD